ncbi:MAG: amino acid adenylation domain-containing protein [Acidobacteriota bacterium]
MVDSVQIEDIYELSPMQHGLLYQTALSPESGFYVEQLHCGLRGELRVEVFERAWQRVVDHYSALRSSFHWQELDKPLQVVHAEVSVEIERWDWRHLAADERDARIAAFLETNRRQGFDLTAAPVMRWKLIRVDDEVHRFVWNFHHLLLDGWSLQIVLGEVFRGYDALCQGRATRLAPSQPFRSYIDWLQAQDSSEAETHWRRALAGFTDPSTIALPSPAEESGEEDRGEQEQGIVASTTFFSSAATQGLIELARQWKVTPNTVAQGIWALLLSRYSGDQDVAFGTVVSGRPAELYGVETIVGNLTNTLPLRLRVDGGQGLAQWIQQIQSLHATARRYEYVRLADIQRWSEVPAGSALFESILVFENFPVNTADATEPRALEPFDSSFEARPDVPLLLELGLGKVLYLLIYHQRHRFESTTIQRLHSHVRTALDQLIARPEQRVGELGILSAAERHQLRCEWSETRRLTHEHRLVHEMFEERAASIPDAVALELGATCLSYRQLDRAADRLAGELRAAGLQLEQPVALCLERGFGMVAAVLGVLKAGGAFVALDPALPEQRIAMLLEDLSVQLIVAEPADHRELWQRLGERLGAPLTVLPPLANRRQSGLERRVEPTIEPRNSAYLTYTSGSTGVPKCIGTSHRGAVNYLSDLVRTWDVGDQDVVLQIAALSFDAAVRDLVGPLVAGARCVLLADEIAIDPHEILHHLLERRVTCLLKITPSLLSEVINAAQRDAAGRDTLRVLLSSGEALSAEHVEGAWRTFGRAVQVANLYGPTECTLTSTSYPVRQLAPEASWVALGRPIVNAQTVILSRDARWTPMGAPGEILIAGTGLARGYLGRPRTTAERFIPHPASDRPGARAYKTGDLGRHDASGNLRFLGRLDHQVKLRGFRVELGEVETQLGNHPAIRACVVMLREDRQGDQRLTVYFVPQVATSPPTEQALRQYLEQRLPHYMVPVSWMPLDALPIAGHGKVDRRALPVPDSSGAASETFVAPRTSIERTLAGIWTEILGVERVGVHDDFFQLGGYSLLLMRVQVRLREHFDLQLPLAELFDRSTLEGLALLITEKQMDELVEDEELAQLLQEIENT